MQKQSLKQSKTLPGENYEEAIIRQEPHGTEYKILEPYHQNSFPFCMVGKLKIYFLIEYPRAKVSESVGTLIGPDIVLTTAHSLHYEHVYEENNTRKILQPFKIEFFPNINGEYSPFRPASHLKFIIPSRYHKLVRGGASREKQLRSNDFDEELLNDYGLIILNRNVGEEIIKLYQLDHVQELILKPVILNKENNSVQLYKFFVESEENMKKVPKNMFMPDFSLISYTKFKENYLQRVHYPYSSSFKKMMKKLKEREIKLMKRLNNPPSNESSVSSINSILEENKDEKKFIQENTQEFTLNKENNTFTMNTTKIDNLSEDQNVWVNKEVLLKHGENEKPIFNNQEIKNYVTSKSRGIDSIIFDEDFAIKFFKEEKEAKGILCEAMGFLDNNICLNDNPLNNLVLRYRVSTYSGQSGSPIFLRIKKKQEHKGKAEKEEKYYFIGIHCQRPKDFQNNISVDDPRHRTHRDVTNNTMINRSDLNDSLRCSLLDTGFSEYNLGLKMTSLILRDITQNIFKEKNDLSYFFKVNSPKTSLNSFVNTNLEFSSIFDGNVVFAPMKIFVSDKLILQGVIRQDAVLAPIFLAGVNIFKDVPIRFISIVYKDQKLDYDLFAFKKIKELDILLKDFFKTKNEKEKIEQSENCWEFEILVNFKEFGSFLAEKIYKKLEESSIRFIKKEDETNSSCLIDEKNHPHFKVVDTTYEEPLRKEVCLNKLKYVHSSIIEQINYLNQFAFIFGTLYNTVKDKLIEKYLTN